MIAALVLLLLTITYNKLSNFLLSLMSQLLLCCVFVILAATATLESKNQNNIINIIESGLIFDYIYY